MNAEAARQALERIVSHEVRPDEPTPCDWHCTAMMRDLAIEALAALREQPSPDAVVGVGERGYTFADGSTPPARDDNTALIEALEQIANPEAGRATSARMLPYEIARAALAAARAGETT